LARLELHMRVKDLRILVDYLIGALPQIEAQKPERALAKPHSRDVPPAIWGYSAQGVGTSEADHQHHLFHFVSLQR